MVSLIGVYPWEADDLADLRVAAMRESLQQLGRFDPIRARERFLGGFNAALTRAIEVEGRRLGFLVLRPIDRALLLDHFYLWPEAQGRGVGAAALSMVFAQADTMQLPLRVGVLKESRANAFYQRHGFQWVESGDWDHYYRRAAQA